MRAVAAPVEPRSPSRMETMRRFLLFVLACIAGAGLAGAQSFDNSANASLSGSYYFRNVLYIGSSAGNGSLSRAIAAYGTMAFDGNGAYSVTGSYFDSSDSRECNRERIERSFHRGAGFASSFERYL